MSTQKIFAIASALSLVGCSNAFLSRGAAGSESGIAAMALSSMTIENGKAVTKDPVLHLNLSSDAEIDMVKVSPNATCEGGEWFTYSPDFRTVTPNVNDLATVSVQFKYMDGSISECMVDEIVHENPNTPKACETSPEVCDREPQVKSAGVVTVLLTLGDELNQSLIIGGSSAQVIAEMAIRFASPIAEPKILVVRDRMNNGESYQDTTYIAQNLLGLYKSVTLIDEPVGGLKASDLVGYDLIWFNNPGHQMSAVGSRDALLAFSGGVVLSGDDMSQGTGFSMEPLTGSRTIDNGTSVTCGANSYYIDNNQGDSYRVQLDAQALPSFPESVMNFRYGNDIDNSVVSRPGVEVIASAQGGPEACTARRPVITRYPKSLQ